MSPLSRSRRPRVAFVLSGGGSHGAQQVGMLKALAEFGLEPDLLVGASVGALNAAWVATRGFPSSVEGLEELWLSLKRQDVFPLDVPALVSAALGRRNFFISPAGLRRIIEDHLTVQTFEETRHALKVVATELISGEKKVFESGALADVLLASAAIPGIFPPVKIGDQYYIDGGVADNTPLSVAGNAGARRIYVLSTSWGCSISEPPTSPLGMLIHATNLLVDRGLKKEVEFWEKKAEVVVFPSVCLEGSGYDFSFTRELIDRAYESAREVLKATS